MFQQTPALFKLAPRMGLLETVDKVKSHLNSDVKNIGNLCLPHRDPPLIMIVSVLFH